MEEHRVHVRQVLQRLLENRLYVKAQKCEFHVPSISFLGYIIGQGQIKMDPSKVSAVAEWPSPPTCKRLQQFLGFANFHRRFIQGYSQVTAPLTALTSTKSSFTWTPEAETAFLGLKKRLVSPPILVQPDPSLQFVVKVDASDTRVGQSSPSALPPTTSSTPVPSSPACCPCRRETMTSATASSWPSSSPWRSGDIGWRARSGSYVIITLVL